MLSGKRSAARELRRQEMLDSRRSVRTEQLTGFPCSDSVQKRDRKLAHQFQQRESWAMEWLIPSPGHVIEACPSCRGPRGLVADVAVGSDVPWEEWACGRCDRPSLRTFPSGSVCGGCRALIRILPWCEPLCVNCRFGAVDVRFAEGIAERPSCWVLVDDSGAALQSTSSWPTHICESTMKATTADWWHRRVAAPSRVIESLAQIWPSPVGTELPFAIGRSVRGDEVDLEILRATMPLDGREWALIALRFAGENASADVFGLADVRDDEGHAAVHFGAFKVVITGTLPDQNLMRLLGRANRFWAGYRGKKFKGAVESGPPPAVTVAAIHAAAARLHRDSFRVTIRAIATALHCDPSTVYAAFKREGIDRGRWPELWKAPPPPTRE